MPSLKDLRNRISSVKSTKKITSAMKMVAAAKLRKAQENALQARPYSEKLFNIVRTLVSSSSQNSNRPSLVFGTEKNITELLIVCSADRGLCGGFNGSVVRYTREKIRKLHSQGKKTKIIFIGKKAFQALKRENSENIIKVFSDVTNKVIDFNLAKEISDLIISNFDEGTFDSCNLIYTQFNSAINQEVKEKSLVPLVADDDGLENKNSIQQDYHYEPDEENILNNVVPQNLSVQLFTALLESVASEQGARMTAMDNATRNANDMIDNLTLFYNRSRQAVITKELIEIISGAEAI